MKFKWFLGTLLVTMVLLGLGNYQNSAPNQEIIVHFNTTYVVDIETQNTIETLKKQLLKVGVQDIQSRKQDNGIFVITYHSNLGIEHIKNILSKDKKLILGGVSNSKENQPAQSPEKDNPNTINLDVYEIQSHKNIDSGLKGYVLNFKPDKERPFNPNVYLFVDVINVNKRSRQKKTSNIFDSVAIVKNYTPHEIPDVRAGPLV